MEQAVKQRREVHTGDGVQQEPEHQESPTQKATKNLSLANLFVGITGLAGPLVTGNEDRIVNVRPGFLFNVFAINWSHALVHLFLGLGGLSASKNHSRSRRFMRFQAVLFTVVAAAGWYKAGQEPERRVHKLMGMAVNTPGNVVHTLWSGIGWMFSRDSNR